MTPHQVRALEFAMQMKFAGRRGQGEKGVTAEGVRGNGRGGGVKK